MFRIGRAGVAGSCLVAFASARAFLSGAMLVGKKIIMVCQTMKARKWMEMDGNGMNIRNDQVSPCNPNFIKKNLPQVTYCKRLKLRRKHSHVVTWRRWEEWWHGDFTKKHVDALLVGGLEHGFYQWLLVIFMMVINGYINYFSILMVINGY